MKVRTTVEKSTVELDQQMKNLKVRLQKTGLINITAGITLKNVEEQEIEMKQNMWENDLIIEGLRGLISTKRKQKTHVKESGCIGRNKYKINVRDEFKGVARGLYHMMTDWARREISELVFNDDIMDRN
ncbi:unnamed protein product [Agarophyton chilense]